MVGRIASEGFYCEPSNRHEGQIPWPSFWIGTAFSTRWSGARGNRLHLATQTSFDLEKGHSRWFRPYELPLIESLW